MKTFKLSLFKGANPYPITTKEVVVASKEELQAQKNGFKNEFRTWFKNPKNWLGVKRIR